MYIIAVEGGNKNKSNKYSTRSNCYTRRTLSRGVGSRSTLNSHNKLQLPIIYLIIIYLLGESLLLGISTLNHGRAKDLCGV